MIAALAAGIEARGFAVLPGHLGADRLAETRMWHDELLADPAPATISASASGSNSRLHLVRPHAGLERLYTDPLLVGLAERLLGPVRLGAFLSRTVHPGAAAQALHADCPHEGGRIAMLGFIFALDDFAADRGATRFVPGSHLGPAAGEEVPAAAPAGSLIVYDGAVLHGFSAHRGGPERRAIQGSFVPRTAPANPDLPRAGRTPLARHLLGLAGLVENRPVV